MGKEKGKKSYLVGDKRKRRTQRGRRWERVGGWRWRWNKAYQ